MIVIYKELKDNKITLTKEELEDLLKQAHDEGYQEGLSKAIYVPSTTPTTPYTPPYYEGTKPYWWYEGPTCNSITLGTRYA